MENSQLLATDSFSYSWLINQKPSFDGLLESLTPSLDLSSETMPIVHHPNKILKGYQDFDFNVAPGSRPSSALVHADEIFSNGCIIPVFANRDRPKMQASTSDPVTPISTVSSRTVSVCSAYGSQYYSCRKGAKSSKRILQKFFSFLKHFCKGFGCSRKSIQVDDMDRKVLEVRSRSHSLQASPDRQTAYAAANWATIKNTSSTTNFRDKQQNPKQKSWSNSPQASTPQSPPHYTNSWYDTESSIHEAIVHCKRSFAN